MGRTPSDKPAKLSKKLIQIRKALGLSQEGLVRLFNLEGKLMREDISKYERGLRVPPLLTLLKYARTAGVYVDALLDDDLHLPEKLPCSPKSEGIESNSLSLTKRVRGKR